MSKPSVTPARLDLPLGSESKIIALRGGQLPLGKADADGKRDLPQRVRFLKWGANDTTKGRVIVNETTAGVLAHNQEVTGHDHVALDFSHNSVKATPKDEPINVAGHGAIEIIPGDGLYLAGIQYTDEGLKTLPGGHYPDVSGAIKVNAAGEVIWVHSVGAVRNGAAPDMVMFELSAESKASEAMALLEASGQLTLDSMSSDGSEVDFREITVALLNSLGAELDVATATDAEIANAAETLRAGADPDAPEKPSAESESEPENDDPTIITMSATAADEKITLLEARLDGMEKDHEATKRDAIVRDAARAGKVIPLSAEDIAETPVRLLQAMVDKLPAGQVDVEGEEVALQGQDTSPLVGGGLTAADATVAKLLGVSLEDMKEHGVLKTA